MVVEMLVLEVIILLAASWGGPGLLHVVEGNLLTHDHPAPSINLTFMPPHHNMNRQLEVNGSEERRCLGAINNHKIMNEIDACWRNDPNWAAHRQSLADCAVGFGSRATGGKYGKIYIVTDAGDDPVNPKLGTLRYGVIQSSPLWIIFERDMFIRLKSELIMNSYKTIDGRGANVEMGSGPCITVQFVRHVIIHGVSIHDCVPSEAGMVRSSPTHVGHRLTTDGDAIDIFGSNNIWIDHCTLSRSADGLVDAVYSSTAITVSNCFFHNHDKAMLLGHNDGFTADKIMRATIAFNRFGPNLVERMPRGRFGYFHVANNHYQGWEQYAIGGSANPTFRSEGNRFVASDNPNTKQVTKRETSGGSGWNWRSINDMFVNGAYFVPSGEGTCAPYYSPGESFTVYEAALVPFLTADAGRLKCRIGYHCC